MKNLNVSREAAARIARQVAENSGVVTILGDHRAAPNSPQPWGN
jgi:hypothetical protein